MILIHEYLDDHIEKISEEISKTFGIKNTVIATDLDAVFLPTKKWEGYRHSSKEVSEYLKKYKNSKSMILTNRDIYYAENYREDDWIFGYMHGNFSVISTARMKREDNKPSKRIRVSKELYLKRAISTAIHEIAHDVVKGEHLLPAVWVNKKNNYRFELGPHCTDNKCVLYEIVDIKTPPKEEGHMLLGKEKKYDTGMDECIERRYDGWFCKNCKDSIVVDKGYD